MEAINIIFGSLSLMCALLGIMSFVIILVEELDEEHSYAIPAIFILVGFVGFFLSLTL